MRYAHKFGPALLTLSIITMITIAAITRRPAQPELTSEVYAQSSNDDQASPTDDALFAGWATEYAEQGLITKTPIPLNFSRAFSKHFTNAHGKIELNFQTNQVAVSAEGLEPLPTGEKYELWLIDHVAGPENTAAIEFGESGDRILNLGPLTPGFIATTINAPSLDTFSVDMAAVIRVAPEKQPEFVIGGLQSIRFQIGRHGLNQRTESIGLKVGNRTLPLTLVQKGGGGPKQLIATGKALFEAGIFGGNGRTCATCHPAGNDFTIDVEFIGAIAAVDPQNPLFVAENDLDLLDLPLFDPTNTRRPALEDLNMMHNRGLILENIRGFARIDPTDPTSEFVEALFFRATPALFNMNLTAPFGLGGDIPDLQIFSAGAVVQHFTKSMNREPGADFVVPTTAQLQALEAFMLSLKSPASGNFKISGRGSLLSTPADPRAIDDTRPEVRGRIAFQSRGCTLCHAGTVLSGGNLNLNTGVETIELTHLNPTPTDDDGNGVGQFQIPQLFGLRKSHFFHNGAARSLRDAVAFYASPEFRSSPTRADVPVLSAGDIDDIAAFLEAISVP